MTIVLAGIVRKVLGDPKAKLRCPYRVKPIKCKGTLSELKNEDGSPRKHYTGWMPEAPNSTRIRRDDQKDPVAKIEAQCDYCLAIFWGRSLKTISEMKLLPQDIATWKNTREIKVMRRFSPQIFPADQIQRAEEMARK